MTHDKVLFVMGCNHRYRNRYRYRNRLCHTRKTDCNCGCDCDGDTDSGTGHLCVIVRFSREREQARYGFNGRGVFRDYRIMPIRGPMRFDPAYGSTPFDMAYFGTQSGV